MRINKRTAVVLLGMAYPLLCLADVTGNITLTNGQRFSFDSGTVVSPGGDLLWNGSTLTPQGSATAAIYGFFGTQATYNTVTQDLIAKIPSSVFSQNPLPAAGLVQMPILIVKTNGGNYAKALVASDSGGSITFQFDTFTSGGSGGGGGAGGGSLTAVENAATNLVPGLPNSPIAQGALFVVKGTGLGPANVVVASSFPLSTTIGGTSVSVTVNGTTVQCIMYYSLATQVAAILPSKTPTGTGTLTVAYNGQTAGTTPITVVPSNIGIFTLNTTGSGDAVATLPATNTVVSPTNAPMPGETVTLWGTGLGPVSFDETQPAQQVNMTGIPLQVFIGGKQASVLFQGRNACCTAVDTIYVAVPQGLTGCNNPVILQIGNYISNTTSIPIGTSGRNCVPNNPNQSVTGASGNQGFGGFSLVRTVVNIAAIGPAPAQSTKSDLIGGSFEKIITNSSAPPPQGSQIDTQAYGSCAVTVTAGNTTAGSNNPTIQGLDAGQVTVTGPGLGTRTLGKSATSGLIIYQLQLDNTATTFTEGNYTFTGAGGPDVGPFTATYAMPQPLVWTNQAALATVNRADGATVTWTGGDPNGYVTITGQSIYTGSSAATSASASFTCVARVSDGSFTVPPIVLLQLPPSGSTAGVTIPGSLGVTSTGTNVTTLTASGIAEGGIGSLFSYVQTATYQ
ncbi:MAG TPA: hypothetical protein VKX49_23800 [Bryobacteraceae bacterium]|nr:hypothetical protein [Bryobacteraceae bacterium]